MAMSLLKYRNGAHLLNRATSCLVLLLFLAVWTMAEEVVTLDEGVIELGAEPGEEMEASSEKEAARQRAENLDAVEGQTKKWFEEHADNPEIMVKKGLLADRREKRIQIFGEALPMNKYDPLEFFLISNDSGHDYEALAVSFARPLAIHRALEFIGVPPGRPVDYDRLQMWPKGERVFVEIAWQDPEDGKRRAYPIEQFVVDIRKEAPLPSDGLVFVGSRWLESPERPGEMLLASEVYDPHSIASDYNEPLTLLDVPRKAVDGEVYSYQRINPDLRLPAGALLEITIEPEYKDGERRVKDLILTVGAEESVFANTLGDLRFELADLDGERVGRGDRLKHFLATVSRLTKRGKDPFITVRPAAGLPLSGVKELYEFLQSIATEGGIRIEPPEVGHLFYRAFLPDVRFRKRATRPSQPWELYLTKEGDTVSAKLVHIEEIWHRDKDYPDLETEDIPIADPEDLRKELDEREPGVPVMLVYAPDDLTYGELMSFVEPVLSTHPTVYVFLSEGS